MIGVMAKRANISKAEMYSKLNFQKASEQDIPQGVKFQVDAFHGSPYEFDKFTTQKIGTGEGAQAFGWGLYFTDLESIAKGYADKLAKAKYDAKSFGEENVGIANRAILNIESTGSVDNAIKFLKDLIEKNKNGDTSKTKEILDFIEKNKDKFTVSKNLYKVSIHEGKKPEQYSWLEWDKPVGKKIKDLEKPVSGPMNFRCDVSLMERLIQWKPQYNIEEGVKLTYERMKPWAHLYRDWETDRKSTRLNSSH